MAARALEERFVRCRQQLSALRPQEDALVSEVVTARTAADTASGHPDFEKLRQELKRKKFMFLATEAQHRFAQSCCDGLRGLDGHKGDDLEMMLQEAKSRDQALVSEISKELEEHHRLCQELERVTKDGDQARMLCEMELEELDVLLQEDDDEATPIDSLLKTPEELATQSSLEAKAKRQRLEQRSSDTPLEVSNAEECLAKLRELEQREIAEVERLQGLAAFEEQLGLPRIVFDDAKGLVVLRRPSSEPEDDLPLRTVKVDFDASGRLLQAETHPSLGLRNEEAASVQADDLGRLLTLAWDRILGQPLGPAAEIAAAGG
eukprot:gb/GFBE01073357.1/.p1 GENE.gb/GFBE01073357.1/~~gb/GFBE01073357.1/.p1  ORF type:complete len:320 (+),score=89.00 gb/GFBE01073357.1/:1-960(+)